MSEETQKILEIAASHSGGFKPNPLEKINAVTMMSITPP